MIGTATVRTLRVATTLPILVTAACSGPAKGPVRTSPAPSNPGLVLLSGVAKARADSLRHPYTEADIHFMSGMISHHAQAIVMARWAPTHGASASVLTLCNRIINAQTDEIALMQQWLRDRQLPVPEARGTGMAMKMNGVEHDMLMPGMLTEDQMRQLDQAKGLDFDRLFLTFMIQHHQGAVTMVKELFDSYGAGQDDLVFKFASDVNIDQTTEITRMEQMLLAVITSSR
jgi:uncharacterized protein (DUF305 family)